MGYLGVSTWDDVLAMFGEGGVMAGAWGFLEVLRQAELGDNISMWMDALNSTQSLPFLVGAFYEQDGQLMFGGTMQIGDNTWQATMGVVAFASLSGNGNPTRFWVQGANSTNAYLYNVQYGHLKFDANSVDWTSVGLGIAALGQDAGLAIGVAGAMTVNPVLMLAGVSMFGLGLAAETTSVAYTYNQYKHGSASTVDLAVSMSSAVIGLAPGPVGITSSFGGILWDMHYGFRLTP